MQSSDSKDVIPKEMEDESEKEISEISEIIANSDIKKEDQDKIFRIIKQEIFKGPLPHPQILQQYEEIQPGFANKIVDMATKEQQHRHDLEKAIVQSELSLNRGQVDVLEASIKLKTRLQIYGFVITTLLLIIGTACIFLGKNIGSITTLILAVGSFCWTMFYGKKNNEDEKTENKDEN